MQNLVKNRIDQLEKRIAVYKIHLQDDFNITDYKDLIGKCEFTIKELKVLLYQYEREMYEKKSNR